MLRLVVEEYPQYSRDYVKLAELISMEFNVECTEQNILDYERMHVCEDYELESKRHIFSLFNGDRM